MVTTAAFDRYGRKKGACALCDHPLLPPSTFCDEKARNNVNLIMPSIQRLLFCRTWMSDGDVE
jgi:hypothetical protein